MDFKKESYDFSSDNMEYNGNKNMNRLFKGAANKLTSLGDNDYLFVISLNLDLPQRLSGIREMSRPIRKARTTIRKTTMHRGNSRKYPLTNLVMKKTF
jgi:hypothetical protein